jgi:hypothetical protein
VLLPLSPDEPPVGTLPEESPAVVLPPAPLDVTPPPVEVLAEATSLPLLELLLPLELPLAT